MTTTALNVACAVQGCTNPVVGQCSCGRYYCVDHSERNLCLSCVQKRQDEEKYKEYMQLAEKVRRDSEPWDYRFWKLFQTILLGLLKLILILIGGSGLVYSITSGPVVEGLVATAGVMLVVGGMVGILKLSIRRQLSQISKRSKKKVAKISQTKPDFLLFYQDWENKKSEQELEDILAAWNGINLASVFFAITAIFAHDSAEARKEEQIRKAVDDELRRRGID